jgi:hypothetical protein
VAPQANPRGRLGGPGTRHKASAGRPGVFISERTLSDRALNTRPFLDLTDGTPQSFENRTKMNKNRANLSTRSDTTDEICTDGFFVALLFFCAAQRPRQEQDCRQHRACVCGSGASIFGGYIAIYYPLPLRVLRVLRATGLRAPPRSAEAHAQPRPLRASFFIYCLLLWTSGPPFPFRDFVVWGGRRRP